VKQDRKKGPENKEKKGTVAPEREKKRETGKIKGEAEKGGLRKRSSPRGDR